MNQPSYVRLALEAGKHVLSEKPIAENTSEARKLIEFADHFQKSSNVTWGVAENFRYLDSYKFAASVVKKLGRVLTFQLRTQTYVGFFSKL